MLSVLRFLNRNEEEVKISAKRALDNGVPKEFTRTVRSPTFEINIELGSAQEAIRINDNFTCTSHHSDVCGFRLVG